MLLRALKKAFRYGGRGAKQVHQQPRVAREIAYLSQVPFRAPLFWRCAVDIQQLPQLFRNREVVMDARYALHGFAVTLGQRSEEHTSELQSLMRISNAAFCFK